MGSPEQRTMSFKRLVRLAITLVVAAVLATACGGDDEGAAPADTGESPAATAQEETPEVGFLNDYTVPEIPDTSQRYRVALIQAHRSDAFAISYARAVDQFGQEHGLDVTVQDAGGYQNVQEQISQIEAAITRNPDAIIIWSTDPTAVVPAVNRAKAAGITVIGALQPPETETEFIVTGDFKLDGKTMATALFQQMGGDGKAMSILGGAGSAYQAALLEGWKEALTEFPDIEVVAERTIPDFDPAKIQSAVEDELIRTPDLEGVMTTTTAMAAAAADAIAAGGRSGEAFSVGEILGDCDQIRLLQEERLAIVLGVPAVYYGQVTVANTIRMLEGESVEELTVIPGNVYTPANIDEAPLELEIAPEFREGCS
jgi:ribose transport system substrate-binding protein